MIGFLLNNNLAPIGSSVISTCSPADLFEQRERNVPLASADVRGGGRLHDEPKEHLRRRLCITKRTIKRSMYLYALSNLTPYSMNRYRRNVQTIICRMNPSSLRPS